MAQSPQSGPRWSPAFKLEPVLFPASVGWLKKEGGGGKGHQGEKAYLLSYNKTFIFLMFIYLAA